MICPQCGNDNIPGADLCDSCGSDLAGLDLPEATAGFRGRLLSDRVDALQASPPLGVGADASVADAVRRMREARHGRILVEKDGRPLGIFTERDVLVRVLRGGRDPEKTPVREVMSRDLKVLDPADPPAFAIYRMVEQELRHIPIVGSGRALGFISVRSVLRFLEEKVIGAAAGSDA